MEAPTQNTKHGELVRYWLASGVLDCRGAKYEDGLAIKLYRMCLEVLQDIYQQRASSSGKRSLRKPTELLQEELGRLYLWGESFAPGQLDRTLNHAEDLRTVVIKALQQIGKLLLYAVKPKQTRSNRSTNLHSQIQYLTVLIDQARSITSQTSDESLQENDCSDSELSSDEDNMLKSGGLEGLARRIQVQTTHLIRLGPTIQKTLMCAEEAETRLLFPPAKPFKVSDHCPAQFYVSSICDKFKQAQDQLVARLGEANWQRHNHVRNIQLDDAENTTFFRPHSAFHDSGIGTSVPDQTGSAASHTSFLSSKFEAKLDGLRVPQCPQQIIEDRPFQCFLCGRNQLNIKNRVDWKMHVFADLKPYICTFSNCNMELAQFPSRAAWAEHEFSQHRITNFWRCAECLNKYPTPLLYTEHLQKMHQQDYSDIGLQMAIDMALDRQENPAEKEECPLCRLVPGCSKRAFIKHVGRHMEQIALLALPRDVEESETSDCDAADEGKETGISMASTGTSRESMPDESHPDDAQESLNSQTLSPAWLVQAAKELQESNPEIIIEAVIEAVINPKLMIRCSDCPGNLYAPGPGKTLGNFEVHLKNRVHLERVEKRLNGDSKSRSSHTRIVDQSNAKPHVQDGDASSFTFLQPVAALIEEIHDSTDAYNIYDKAYGADADRPSAANSAAGPLDISEVPEPCGPPPPYSVQIDNGKSDETSNGRAAPPGRCHSCNRGESPKWRRGPDGSKTLCNACGLHYAKLVEKLGQTAPHSASNLRTRGNSSLLETQSFKKQFKAFSEYDSGSSSKLVSQKKDFSDLTQCIESKSTPLLSNLDQREEVNMVAPKLHTEWPSKRSEAGLVQDLYSQEQASSNSHSKLIDKFSKTTPQTEELERYWNSKVFTPWTPAEEQRLREMRDAGETWGETAKAFSHRTAGSVKKHWYKDMLHTDFEGDDEGTLPAYSTTTETNKNLIEVHDSDTNQAIKEVREE